MSKGKRTVVANGTVAADYGVFAAHLVIDGDRIAAVTVDDDALAGADEVIDARGLVVLPGAIDMHAHFEDPGAHRARGLHDRHAARRRPAASRRSSSTR